MDHKNHVLKTILITGARGFVGTNLYEALSENFHLLGLDIAGPGKYPPGDFFGWEDLDELPPVDTIIHLAGKAHDTANTSREEEYFEVNLGLTQKIFDWFLQSSARKFIFFSSVKAVADTVKGEWLTEEDLPEPQTPYGRSKLAAELYMLKSLAVSQSLSPDNSPPPSALCSLLSAPCPPPSALSPKLIYILRPAMIHGPGNKGNLNLLYKLVSKGFPWPLGAFENKRSFTSMENCSFVISRLLNHPVPPGIYNLADDDPLSTNTIIRLMAESRDFIPRIWRIPPGIIRTAARAGDFLHLPLNRERLKKLTEDYMVSNAKLKSAYGIEKMPVSAEEGIRKTLFSRNK